MATIDQQFVEYIVKNLVNNPDEVAVERKIDEKGVLLSLTVAPEDVGRVIGKRGATAQSLRVLLRALGTKQDARYNLRIVNTDENGYEERRDTRAVDEQPRVAEDVTENDSLEETEVSEEEPEEISETSELAEKTRAELADLDDLDI